MSSKNHGAKSATDGSTASGRTLARHLSMRADEYAHTTAAPLYDLGDGDDA